MIFSYAAVSNKGQRNFLCPFVLFSQNNFYAINKMVLRVDDGDGYFFM